MGDISNKYIAFWQRTFNMQQENKKATFTSTVYVSLHMHRSLIVSHQPNHNNTMHILVRKVSRQQEKKNNQQSQQLDSFTLRLGVRSTGMTGKENMLISYAALCHALPFFA